MQYCLIAILFFQVFTVNSSAIGPFRLRWMNHVSENTFYDSKDYPDSVFVLHTYFLACHFNHKLEPAVNALAKEYEDEPRVQVLDIGIDSKPSDYDTWIDKHRPNHPVLNDVGRLLISQLQTQRYPTTYILDSELNIKFEWVSLWNENALKRMREVIDENLSPH